MQRFCETCRRHRPLRDFDLGADGEERLGEACRSCAGERGRAEDLRAREKIVALERQRRTLIASLVKIDAEIAVLRGVPRSSPFERVDPAVLDNSDDRGFGD